MEEYEFLKQATGLSGPDGLRLLIEQVTTHPSALHFFRGFDGLPDTIPVGSQYFGVEQRADTLRRELAEVQAWTDAEAHAKLAGRRAHHEEFLADQAARLEGCLATVAQILKLVLTWRPQFDDAGTQERAEILRAGLITRLAGMRDWAIGVDRKTTKVDDLAADSGPAYREAEIKRLHNEIAEAEASITRLYADFAAELPVLLALRRFFGEMAAAAA